MANSDAVRSCIVYIDELDADVWYTGEPMNTKEDELEGGEIGHFHKEDQIDDSKFKRIIREQIGNMFGLD